VAGLLRTHSPVNTHAHTNVCVYLFSEYRHLYDMILHLKLGFDARHGDEDASAI
jgi:hypothetical protein